MPTMGRSPSHGSRRASPLKEGAKALFIIYGMILFFFRYRSSSEKTQPQYFWI